MPRKSTILIGAFSLVYIAARLWRLTDSCLWFDEIFSIHAAKHPWGEIIPFIAKDLIHPPLFYVLLKLWTAAGGESLFWLRLLPVVFSVLALYPLWMLCRELKLRQSTIVVVFGLFAANGALIKYAQEVRMYSLLLFLSLMSAWLFSRYYFRGKSFWMLVIVNVLLVYTHSFGWFVVLSEVLVIVIAQRIKILRTLLMLAMTAAAFVPWVIALFRFAEPGSSVTQNIGWMRRPGPAALFELAFDLVDPFYFQQSSVDAGAFYPIAVPLLLIVIAAKVLYLVNLKNESNKDRFFFLSVFAVFPVLLVFLLSWLLPVSIWGSRHLLIVFAPVTVAIAIYLTDTVPDILRYLFLGTVFTLAASAFVVQLRSEPPDFIWCKWENAASEFADRRDTVAHEQLYAFEDLTAYHLWFSLRNKSGARVVLVKGTGVPEDPAYFLPRGFDGVRTASENEIEGESVWLAFRAKEVDETKPPVSNLISKGYKIVETVPFRATDSMVYLIRLQKADRK